MKNFLKFSPPVTNEFHIKSSEPSELPDFDKTETISHNLSKNTEIMENLMHYPDSSDLRFRFLTTVINNTSYDVLLIFYDGMIDSNLLDNYIIKQFFAGRNSTLSLHDIVLGDILAENQISDVHTYDEIIRDVLRGNCAVFIDTLDVCFICDVKKIPSRSISRAEIEMNIKGPSESFIETIRTNTALIRKFVKDENLIFENIEVGDVASTKCAIAYISGLTNLSIVDEVKRRISEIKVDYLIDAGQLEQLIEDKTYISSPLILSTEKPDKVASNLTEGRVAILVEGSPDALIVPVVLADFLHATDDSYIRFPYALLLRFFRIPAMFLGIFLPGIYIALVLYHQEMIPTDLLFSIASARESVPFPLFLELLIMELFFEIIREASLRTPAPIGPTLGIVGTLILGQAIVSANVVSPILIIIVALTGISSFAVPNFALNYSYRILRFIYIILGGFFGFLGISLGVFVHLCILTSTSSFGAPYLSPFAPANSQLAKDDLLISPIWKQELRPLFLKPRKIKKEPKISRKWTKGG